MGKGGASPDDLAALISAYGTTAKALVAARRLWDVTSVEQLTDAQVAELMRVRV
jgi:hypothetical protein